MTAHPHRFYGGNDLHFLTFSCYHRQPFFQHGTHCDLFLKILDGVRRRYRLVVLGYVVMPEHVHLLVSEPQRETLSTVVQALKLGVVRSIECGGASPISRTPMSRKNSETWGIPICGDQNQHKPASPKRFWQARFYDFNVWTEKKRIEKLSYIHGNPVTRGLVAAPEQWPWTSFRWYLSGETGPVRINDTNIPRNENPSCQRKGQKIELGCPRSRRFCETWEPQTWKSPRRHPPNPPIPISGTAHPS